MIYSGQTAVRQGHPGPLRAENLRDGPVTGGARQRHRLGRQQLLQRARVRRLRAQPARPQDQGTYVDTGRNDVYIARML